MGDAASDSLSGLVIAITRDLQAAFALSQKITDKGGVARHYPLFEILYRNSADIGHAARLFNPEFVIFTSVHGVKAYEVAFCSDRSHPWFALPCACVGSRTAQAAQQLGLTVVLEPDQADAKALSAQVAASPWCHKRILWVRGNLAVDEDFALLKAKAMAFLDVIGYDTVPTLQGDRLWHDVLAESVDVVLFMSGSAVRPFALALESSGKTIHDLKKRVLFVSIGHKTTQVMQEYGLYPHVTASTPSADSMLQDLARYIHREKG